MSIVDDVARMRRTAEGHGFDPGTILPAVTTFSIAQLLVLLWTTSPSSRTVPTVQHDDAALGWMIIAQLAIASLFSPILLANLSCSIASILTIFPFAALAMVVSASSLQSTIAAVLVVVLCMWILTAAMQLSSGRVFRSFIAAVSSSICIGSMALGYISADFKFSTSFHPAPTQVTPIQAALRSVRNGNFERSTIYVDLALLIVLVVVNFMLCRARLATSYPQPAAISALSSASAE